MVFSVKADVQVLGWIAMSGTILPFVEVPFPAAVISHSYNRHLKVPFVKVSVLFAPFL